MHSDTGRDPAGPGIERRYRRRRAAALAGVAGVVVTMAWACAGGEDDAARVQSAPVTPSGAVPPAMPTVTVTASPSSTDATDPSGAPASRGACAAESLVVAMKATDSAYGAGERPRFMVTVVNIGDAPCALGAGSGEVDLSITSGDDRVWSSAACAGGGSSRPRLRQGVPYTRTITWDRRRGAGDCGGDRAQARPGTYVATLTSPTGPREAPKQVFTLR